MDLSNPRYFSQALDIINADRLLGQPLCDEKMLRQALNGFSPVDGGYWEELKSLRHIGVVEADELTGAAAIGVRNDGTGVLLWLYARENEKVVDDLIRFAEKSLAECGSIKKQEAFGHATALGLGLEALPKNSRPATVAALERQGYTGEDLWLYMHGTLQSNSEALTVEISPGEDDHEQGHSVEMVLPVDGKQAVKASVGIVGNTGVIWWIETAEQYRRQGLGRKMFRQIKSYLSSRNATELILYVDHDDPDTPGRDRRPAIELYKSEGLQVVDHLWSYTKLNNIEDKQV